MTFNCRFICDCLSIDSVGCEKRFKMKDERVHLYSMVPERGIISNMDGQSTGALIRSIQLLMTNCRVFMAIPFVRFTGKLWDLLNDGWRLKQRINGVLIPNELFLDIERYNPVPRFYFVGISSKIN